MQPGPSEQLFAEIHFHADDRRCDGNAGDQGRVTTYRQLGAPLSKSGIFPILTAPCPWNYRPRRMNQSKTRMAADQPVAGRRYNGRGFALAASVLCSNAGALDRTPPPSSTQQEILVIG